MLTVHPQSTLFDRPVRIHASQLTSNQSIRIRCQLNSSDRLESVAKFIADANGTVDVSTDASIDGSYVGINQMGLFSFLQPISDNDTDKRRKYARYLPRIVDRPVEYRLELIDDNDRILSTLIVYRHFMHQNVERRDIEIGRIHGTLFTRKDCSRLLHPQPAILDLFGIGGGKLEYRAALLAARGYAVLALAHSNYKDLPKKIDDVDINYFKEAIDWLTSQPYITNYCAIVGLCLGGTYAIVTGCYFSDKIRAIVAMNSSPLAFEWYPVKLNGQQFPYDKALGLNLFYNKTEGTFGTGILMRTLPLDENLIFPVEKAQRNTKWLIVASEDDEMLASVRSARLLSERMGRFGLHDQMDTMVVPAGHLVEVPYMPFCSQSYHAYFQARVLWGGEPYSHCRTQEIVWFRVLDFLQQHLIDRDVVIEQMAEFCPPLYDDDDNYNRQQKSSSAIITDRAVASKI